jgi:hypothetical protein
MQRAICCRIFTPAALLECPAASLRDYSSGVLTMAAQHQRGHAEDMREAIILIQNAIEAIDRAISDERRMANGYSSSSLKVLTRQT